MFSCMDGTQVNTELYSLHSLASLHVVNRRGEFTHISSRLCRMNFCHR